MSFVSFSFISLFLVTLAGRFWLGPTHREKPYLLFLLAASLVFYASFVPQYLLLLLFTTGVDFYAGQKIFESSSKRIKITFLILSLSANLGLLAFFKYAHFAFENIQGLLGLWGLHPVEPMSFHWVLPIGISFFTFQSMSYTIDIYRGEIQPEKRYWRFLLFVSFFTHLVSGPIVRAKELLYQFDRKRRARLGVFLQGLYLMIFGFFLKMVVADNLAAYVDKYWARGAAPQMPGAVPLALAFLFACQIFADFFGYSTIAMGAAYLLGFKLPVNFNSPYIAGSFREFWTRWHITLSRWIRDYLYISMGGNKGSSVRRFLVLMAAMVLAGLWHGAAVTFLIWGALHGFALAVERVLGFQRKDPNRPLALRAAWFLVVQALVMTAWVFFRAENPAQALLFLENILGPHFGLGYLGRITPAFLFAAPVGILHLRSFAVERGWISPPGLKEKAVLSAMMLYCVITLYGKNNAFLYFQF